MATAATAADHPEVKVSLIAAMARDRVIGLDGDMPWHLPTDLAHFKAVTLGKPVIMGRRTWESIGRPLPGRHNIVVSKTLCAPATGIDVVTDLATAIGLGGSGGVGAPAGVGSPCGVGLPGGVGSPCGVGSPGTGGAAGELVEVMIIGGGRIYREAMPWAQRMYLTLVDLVVEGDTWFPAYAETEWREVASQEVEPTETQPGMRMVTLERC